MMNMCEKIDEEEVRIREIEIKHLTVLEYLNWKAGDHNEKSR